MIVVDASAMVQALVGRGASPTLLDLLTGDLAAPHLLDVEVLSALRGLLLGGHVDAIQADDARRTYFEFAIERHEESALAERVWTLRNQFTAYDASYLALAEGLDVPLVTCDAKMATTGHTAVVRVMSPDHR